MATNNKQKLKLLHLMDILRTETDPEHGLTMPQLIEKLAEQGLTAERKSLYRDIKALQDFGMDIRTLRKRPVQYCLAERDFELSQLTLLVDAVQSSRFLSDGASRALVKSIKLLASTPEQDALNKQVHVHGRPSRQNQSDFIAVDKLQDAIADRRKVSFRYFKYDANKARVARRAGADHLVTPMNLTYSDGNYYLVAYNSDDRKIRNYRVDRMEHIERSDEPAERNDAMQLRSRRGGKVRLRHVRRQARDRDAEGGRRPHERGHRPLRPGRAVEGRGRRRRGRGACDGVGEPRVLRVARHTRHGR